MRILIVVLLSLVLAACATPSTIALPDDAALAAHRIELSDISALPPPVTRVMSGDTLRIVRNAQTPAEKDEATLFFVRPDGAFAYPHAGLTRGAGRTPEDIGADISARLASLYRQPQVTVNIAAAPGNRVFVGGAVRNPSAYELAAAATLEQAVIGAGGVLPSADSEHVALLRLDGSGLYRVYFADIARMLDPSSPRRGVELQRGDVVFVPKSKIGRMTEGVDMYVNQLLPFSRGLGLGLNYDLRGGSGNSTINNNNFLH
ncbi:polysaccharide export protein [Chromobacterium violaceum]|uniref:polysaccharide biosynthesis/export family protein n=1 Tax=Chromobacterium violaceum TaxID=536 RepID=UPI001B3390E0|nr:polysaccharide biosynthesis/export family protein [Chromobacterium violaceum]MBP4048072.1 polysaccharide export protein [Chromobacterium violaceum]